MRQLPEICHRLHPDIAAEVERLDGYVVTASNEVAVMRNRLAAIRVQLEADSKRNQAAV